MDTSHLTESDLALLSELDVKVVSDDKIAHLQWCPSCRALITEHRWLKEEVSSALRIAVSSVPIPRSKWWAVREGLRANRRNQIARSRVLVMVSALLAVSLTFFRPLVSFGPLSTAATIPQTDSVPLRAYPSTAVATAPTVSISLDDRSIAPEATPTPIIVASGEWQRLYDSTPMCLQPPTPPRSNTLNL